MKLFTLVKALFLVASISFSHRILWAVNSQANSILLDQKGNVVIGGFANNESTNRTDFLCARYLPDGILDTTFNANGPNPGIVQISPALIKLPESTDLGITGLALDKQGRIVVLGYVDTDGIGSSMMVLRLHPDGTLDTTFNPSGSFGPIPGVVLITHSAFGEVGTAVAIDSQGRIIGVGTTDDGQNLGIVVFRLLPDGTTDTSFNSQKTLPGRFTFSRSNSDTVAQAVALHADDSIMIAGYLTVSFQSDFLLIKLTPQGDLDRTFNVQSQTPGIIVQDITGFDNRAYALKIDSQGRSLIGGYTSNENGSEFFALARYTASGELDTSFNAAGIGTGIPGIVSTDVTESAIVGTASVIRSLAVTQTDAIVVAGYVLNEIGQSFATARYTSEGLLDTTYNSSGSLPGIVIQTIYPQENLRGFGQSDSTNQFNAVVIGSQNELYGAGYAFDGLQNNCSVLSYSAHGQLNSVFNTEGLISGKPGIVITQVGNPLTALGNGSTYPTEQDSSQVNPEILTDLQNPPKPQLPRIHSNSCLITAKKKN